MTISKKQREFDECLDSFRECWQGTEQALLDYLLLRKIYYGSFDIVKGLIKAGANINHIDYHGENGKYWLINGTPLDLMNKYYDISPRPFVNTDTLDVKSMFRFLRKNGAKTKKELKNDKFRK